MVGLTAYSLSPYSLTIKWNHHIYENHFMRTILLVDDSKEFRDTMKAVLEAEGWATLSVGTGAAALEAVQRERVDVVLLDFKLPRQNGLAVLDQLKKSDPKLPVIMLTAFGEVGVAVEAMRKGAFDYLTKTADPDEVLVRVRKALDLRALSQEADVLRDLAKKQAGPTLVVESPAMQQVQEQIRRVAGTDFTVLIMGESGTGKEVVARLIHEQSGRSEKPFVPLDCGALPETLLESELFGYEKGAFTGAENRKRGYFEMAFQGTLFLDEISNLQMTGQAKLLRVLEQRTIQHLGGTQAIDTDVRVIAASNKELRTVASQGQFRDDLLHRLEEFVIHLPPLRDRREDIVPLAQHFLAIANQELGKSVQSFSPDALQRLTAYHWPGNIRELRNAVKQAVLSADTVVGTEHLQVIFRFSVNMGGVPFRKSIRRAAGEAERQLIVEALEKTRHNKVKTAKFLGMSRSVLYEKLKKYGIQ